jgi:hypothetical protein
VKEQPELKVEMVPVDQLTPYYNNAKKHSHEQIDQICKSIQEFGFNDALGCWINAKGEIEIVEGHGRLYAADKLGLKEVPVVFLNHLTDEQRRAYTHVHNQLTMNTGWDFEILEEEFQALPEFEWEDFGFTNLNLLDALAGGELDMYSESENDRELFEVTLNVPIQYRNQIERFIKADGKGSIVAYLIESSNVYGC